VPKSALKSKVTKPKVTQPRTPKSTVRNKASTTYQGEVNHNNDVFQGLSAEQQAAIIRIVKKK
jgi:hypothetical protein